MSLLAWNIQHGGGTRIPRIVEEIAAYDPDVVAVTEYRAIPGVAQCAAMKERGLPYVETTNPPGDRNGIAVLSRAPMRLKPCQASPESQVRWLDIDLPEYGFSVGILHIMAAGASMKSPCTVAKTRFWNAVLGAAEARFHEPSLLVGGWNTGAHRLDEVGKTFICSEHFAKLSAIGWTDMWRHHHPGTTEYTWHSKVQRRRAREMDSASITSSPHRVSGPTSRPAGTPCGTGLGVTDHSMVIVEVE